MRLRDCSCDYSTLVVAKKSLSSSEFASWKREYDDAKNDVVDRAKRLSAAAGALERGMVYVGVTAIEDKLQEGVPDAIASLRRAGLKIWVLTGVSQTPCDDGVVAQRSACATTFCLSVLHILLFVLLESI